MAALVRLPRPVLLKRCVLPVVTYYVPPGHEAAARVELATAIADLAAITDMQLIVSLHVEFPLPNLLQLMDMLRRHANMVGFCRSFVTLPPLNRELKKSQPGAGD